MSGLKFVVAVLVVSYVPATGMAQDAPPNSAPKLKEVFNDDFATDSRGDYQTGGKIDWEPEQLTLSPGSFLSQRIVAGEWVEVELDLVFPPVSEKFPLTVLDFHWFLEGTTNCVIRWESRLDKDGRVNRRLIVLDTIPSDEAVKPARLIRGWTFSDFKNGLWRLSHRHGLVSIKVPENKKGSYGTKYLAQIDKKDATISKVGLSMMRGSIRIDSIALSLIPPQAPLTLNHRKQLSEIVLKEEEASRLYAEENYSQSLQIMEEVFKIQQNVMGTNHPSSIMSLNKMAILCREMGDYTNSERLYIEALESIKEILGPDHLGYSSGLSRLAILYESMDNPEKAIPLYADINRIHKAVLGSNHPRYSTSLNNLAVIYMSMGDYAKAEPIFIESHDIREKALGTEHPDYVESLNNLAALYHLMGDYTKAEPILIESIDIRKKVLGTEHPDYASSLSDLASLYHVMGDYTKAKPICLEARDIRIKVLGTKHPDHAQSLNNLAAIYMSMGDYAKAEPIFIESRDIRKKAIGTEHPDYASSLSNLALLYSVMGDYAKAEPICLEARDIRKRVLGTEHPDYAASLNNLANLYQLTGDYSKAKLLYTEVLEISKNVKECNDVHYARSLNGLAELNLRMSNFSKAESLQIEALQIRKSALGIEHPDCAESMNNLADIYKFRGEYAKAEPLLLEAHDIRKRVLGIEHPDYADSLNSLASLYLDKGDYVKGEPLLLEARAIRKKVLGTEHPDYASILNQLAALYHFMGDYAQAESLYTQALEITEKTLGINHHQYSLVLNNLSLLYADMGHYSQAKINYARAIEIKRNNVGEDHPEYASSLLNLGTLFISSGDFAQAESLLIAGLKIQRKALGSEHPRNANGLNNLAMLYASMGDYAKAKSLFIEARDIRKSVLGTEHPDYAASLNNLALLYRVMGDYAQAEPLITEAVEIMRQNLNHNAAIQSERQQMAMLKENRCYLHHYLSIALAADQAPQVPLSESLLWKGAIFIRQHSFRQLRNSNDPRVQQVLGDLTETARRRATLSFQTPNSYQVNAWREKLATLATQQEELESQLGQVSDTFREGEQTAQLTPQQLQKLLPSGTALIDFIEYGIKDRQAKEWQRSLLAFVVTADNVIYHELGAVSNLKPLIDQWNNDIQQGAGSGTAVAAQLRQNLWEPLAAQLEKFDTVLISPDGVLTSLPFAALPGKQPGTYLLEEKSIVTIPFPQILKLWQDAGLPLSNGNLLLVGDVDFNNATDDAVPSTSDSVTLLVGNTLNRAATGDHKQVFPSLPGTKQEMQQLAMLHQQKFSKAQRQQLTGAGATEELLRQSVHGQQIIHLATHGFFAPPDVISLARSEEPERMMSLGDQQRPQVVGHPPGVMSGVVLAGANKPLAQNDFTSEDGILTASEVQELNLDGTEMVVLSACETGLGQVAGGEGVLGLQRAFHMAGARNVVTSLWKVNDDATAALMSLFYHNLWQKKQSPPVALRNAQLVLLNHPEAISDDEKLASLTTRGLDFSQPQKIDPKAEPRPQSKRTPIHLWAAFTHSGPPPVMAP